MRSGQQKSQLVADGRLVGSGPGGAYEPQLISLACPCQLASGGCSALAGACDTASNAHGSNRYDRAAGRLEMVVGSHLTEAYVEVRTMPVVAVSLTLSTSIDDFYRNKAAFLSSLAFVLGIDPRRITIVDVVAGSRRGGESWRRVLAGGAGAAVSLEIVPEPVVSFAQVRTSQTGERLASACCHRTQASRHRRQNNKNLGPQGSWCITGRARALSCSDVCEAEHTCDKIRTQDASYPTFICSQLASMMLFVSVSFCIFLLVYAFVCFPAFQFICVAACRACLFLG